MTSTNCLHAAVSSKKNQNVVNGLPMLTKVQQQIVSNYVLMIHALYSLSLWPYLGPNVLNEYNTSTSITSRLIHWSFTYLCLLRREIMLVADSLRLGGAILGQYPDMLAPQLVGRLLSEVDNNKNISSLLRQCDEEGLMQNALVPTYHCMHTPGGPLKYSLEGHQVQYSPF